jgi:nitrogen PTS system EIIA component
MDIRDFLAAADVLSDVRASDKPRLLHDLCRRAAAELKLEPALVSELILKREELGSTGTGNGIAIPHARLPELTKPYGVLARLRKGLDFAAIDDAPVDLVFLLLLPAAAAGEQLSALASVARKLRDPEIAATLRRARDTDEMYRVIAGS